jgi:hypothetical protein
MTAATVYQTIIWREHLVPLTAATSRGQAEMAKIVGPFCSKIRYSDLILLNRQRAHRAKSLKR